MWCADSTRGPFWLRNVGAFLGVALLAGSLSCADDDEEGALLLKPTVSEVASDPLAGTDQTILDNAMKETLVRVYTADELNALAAFYGTGIGKEISQKQDKFFAQMMPILVQALMRQALS